MTEAATGHALARRLLRLPHVAARSGRSAHHHRRRESELVYGPLVDAQEYPHDVDVTIVEGAVSTQDDLEKIRHVRERTRIVVALGDCAITSNVSGMRNHDPGERRCSKASMSTGADVDKGIPTDICRCC